MFLGLVGDVNESDTREWPKGFQEPSRSTAGTTTAGNVLVRMIPLSILDLSPIVAGSDASRAFRNTLDLAQHAEAWGYNRFWLAEHHNMPGIASAATSVVIGHVAGGTSRIRVGAGGIMLPNHSPLVIAEQFGTLEALYPGRIDPRRSGHGTERPRLAARVEHLQRAARGQARIALCLRLALRTRSTASCARAVSHVVRALGVSRTSLRDGGRQRHRGGQRRRSTPPVHITSATVRRAATRPAHSATASGRRYE
jgi:hypothetical protein